MGALQINRVVMGREFKEEKKLIKMMTRVSKRPSLLEIKESKEYWQLKQKYSESLK